MKNRKKLTFAIIAGALVLLTICGVFLLIKPLQKSTDDPLSTAMPSKPEGTDFAQTGTELMSDEQRFIAYDPAHDPAHPELNSPVKLYISNLGSRPGQPRPQDLNEEYPAFIKTPAPTATPTPAPTTEPAVTLNPFVLPPVSPGLPPLNLELPDLYLLDTVVQSPQFTDRAYTLRWSYTAGRNAMFTVSLSNDGGETFHALSEGLTEESFTLTLPSSPVKTCVLRVTAIVGSIEYATADTEPFELVQAPQIPLPIPNYVDEQVQYTDMPGAHISDAFKAPVWFKAENSAEGTVKLIWQLSDTPFWGAKESFSFETPLAAGELPQDAGGEFSIDLAALCEQLNNPSQDENAAFLPKKPIYALYLRVVALDSSGEPIGDPGQGISFTYGSSQIIPDARSIDYAQQSRIGILIQQPYYYEYSYQRVSPGVLNRDISSPPDRMLLAAISDDAQTQAVLRDAVQVEIQVATSPFANSILQDYAKPIGLVYSFLDTAPDVSETLDGSSYMTPYSHGLEYKQFAPPREELDKLGGIYYYARAVFYVPDVADPSVLRPVPSETLTIAYRVTKATENQVQRITVRSDVPYVQFVRYMPVQWQAPDYDEYFQVTRHIEAEEMTFKVRKTGSDEWLYPYAMQVQMYHWTREQYQQKLDEILPPGTTLHYLKSEPAGFWHEFFSLLTDIYSAVQNAYAGAKDAAVSFIDYIPLIGDDARDYLKKAARIAIDYGLASIGLPPSLPNLDVLAEGSLEYVLRVAVDEALQQAGVPADSAAAQEITDRVTKEVAYGIEQGLEASFLATRQNPFHVDFLRLHPDALYEPAYIDVSVANYSEKYTTVGGTLGLHFGDATRVYRPTSVTIPPLKPGEHTIIRVYLDHVRNLYDGYGQYFDDVYQGRSYQPFELRVYTNFDLPDVRDAAKAQGLSPAPLPYVTEYVYDHAFYEYSRPFVPAEPIWTGDDSVNPVDYFDADYFDKYQ